MQIVGQTGGAFSLSLPIHFSGKRNRQIRKVGRCDFSIDLGSWSIEISLVVADFLFVLFFIRFSLLLYINSQIVQVLK